MTLSAARVVLRRRFDRLPIPGWVIAAIAAGVVLLAAALGGIAVKASSDAAAAALRAKHYSGPVLGVDMPLVAVLGDGIAAKERGIIVWTKPLAAALGTRVDRIGDAGAGYVHQGVGGETFVKRAAAIAPATTVVVLIGGARDTGERPAAVSAAVQAAVSAVHTAAPAAKVVVVGPAVASKAVLAASAAMHAGATAAGALWVDPIAGHWLTKTDVASDGMTLTAAGQAALSARMTGVLKPLVATR